MPERILRAAVDEFAAHGGAGARVARIADAAGANKERLYHYFGDKDALFAAAVGEALREIAEAEPFAPGDLGAYVAAMIEFHAERPALVDLLLAEAAAPGALGGAAAAARRAHYARRVDGVREAQAAGVLRDDLDPRIVVYAVLALVVTARALPGITEAILGPDADLAAGLRPLVGALTAPAGS
jgi:AcrR family transcriptional regulator